MSEAQRLRELASWYHEFAERAENPTIWDLRLRTAEDLEKAADELSVAGAGRARVKADAINRDAPL